MTRLNPVAVAAVVSAGMKVLVLLGIEMSTELQWAVLTFVDAVLALFVSSQVATAQTLRDAGTSRTEVRQVACNHTSHMTQVVDGRPLQDWERPRD